MSEPPDSYKTPPATISRETREDPRALTFADLGGLRVAVIYCGRNLAGAFWMPAGAPGSGFWTSWVPITFREFMEFIALNGVKFSDKAALAAWSAHVTEAERRSN